MKLTAAGHTELRVRDGCGWVQVNQEIKYADYHAHVWTLGNRKACVSQMLAALLDFAYLFSKYMFVFE